MAPESGQSSGTARASLIALFLGNFVIGTGLMVVPGLLNQLSDAFDVSIARAGLVWLSIGAMLVSWQSDRYRLRMART